MSCKTAMWAFANIEVNIAVLAGTQDTITGNRLEVLVNHDI